MVADILFCTFFGWYLAAMMHPLSFVFGLLLGSLYFKIPFVNNGLGDLTLFQWIKGEVPGEELAWTNSWSEKRKQIQEEQKQQEEHEKA